MEDVKEVRQKIPPHDPQGRKNLQNPVRLGRIAQIYQLTREPLAAKIDAAEIVFRASKPRLFRH
tara:strand:- start:418 stop:609 length:192 start_codon:yes stop_codon:yes gene_type:complete